jgi:hypothetical protein
MLGRLAAAAVRSGGRLVVAQVVPDTMTPWDIRRKTSKASTSLWGLASKAARKKAKKKPVKNSARNSSPPGRKPPKDSPSTRPKFDKNSWQRGGSLRSPDKWADDQIRNISRSSSPSGSRSIQQLRDFAKHPILVLQMKGDELTHSAKQVRRDAAEELRILRSIAKHKKQTWGEMLRTRGRGRNKD